MVEKIDQRIMDDGFGDTSPIVGNHLQDLRLVQEELEQDRTIGKPVRLLDQKDRLVFGNGRPLGWSRFSSQDLEPVEVPLTGCRRELGVGREAKKPGSEG